MPRPSPRSQSAGSRLESATAGARTAAAYLTITSSGAADRLLGGATPAARDVEVHDQVEQGGLTRMVHITALEIPAGEVVLAPGGLHLMLVDLAGPLVAGTTVTLSLRFEADGRVELDVPVVDARTASPHAQH